MEVDRVGELLHEQKAAVPTMVLEFHAEDECEGLHPVTVKAGRSAVPLRIRLIRVSKSPHTRPLVLPVGVEETQNAGSQERKVWTLTPNKLCQGGGIGQKVPNVESAAQLRMMKYYFMARLKGLSSATQKVGVRLAADLLRDDRREGLERASKTRRSSLMPSRWMRAYPVVIQDMTTLNEIGGGNAPTRATRELLRPRVGLHPAQVDQTADVEISQYPESLRAMPST